MIDVRARFAVIGFTQQAVYEALGMFTDITRASGTAVVLVTHTGKARHGGDPFLGPGINRTHGCR